LTGAASRNRYVLICVGHLSRSEETVMRKFISTVTVLFLGLIFIIFAVANRHLVTVSFDPFNSTDPSLAVRLPLFIVMIAVAMLGVLAGGMMTWFRQGRWRRAARQHEAEAREARAQLADLRAATVDRHASVPPFPALVQGTGYGAAGRDKQIARL
jgi:uncharacterized integral membrane protein